MYASESKPHDYQFEWDEHPFTSYFEAHKVPSGKLT